MTRSIKNRMHNLNAIAACLYYQFPGKKLNIIGVTGTDGKTTTTHLLYEMLREARYKTSMLSTIHAVIGGKEYETGFHTTTPNPWFLQKMLRQMVDAGDTHVVLEVTSHGLDQNRVWGIAFNIGILTNITHDHIDYHKTHTHYARSKLKLLKRSRVAIVNRDDDSFEKVSRSGIGKIISYGIKQGDVTWDLLNLTPKIPGEHNKRNILAAVVAAQQLGVSPADIKKVVESFTGIAGRYEKVYTPYGFSYIIDFAHTPNAFKELLTTVRKETKGRIIHVFGCTGERDYTKRPIMGLLSEKLADVTIITEDDNRNEDIDRIINQIKSGIKRLQNVFVYKFRQDAINFATSIAKKGDVIVLTGKGHEKTILRGKIDHPWSERNAIEKALKRYHDTHT